MLVRFGKRARLRFISHLDLQRFLHMALNRTGLPIQYSQGFNPHPIMAFGSALALGWTSEYELVDVKLAAPMGRARCEQAFRQALPEDLPVLELRLVDDKHPSVMASVFASDYAVRFPKFCESQLDALHREIRAFMDEEIVMALKKTKSGEREINVRPLVLSLDACEGGFNARLMLTEKESLKADLLAKLLCERAAIAAEDIRVHRKALLGHDGSGALKAVMEL